MVGQTQESALDLGPHKTAPGTQRFCAATGAVRPVDEMIRFVMSPDGVAVPDLKRRLPGRGMWITATRQALHAALERNAFARAFKRDVRVTPDVVDTTERLIERTALEALAICHKAGKVAIGFSNVAAALARARVVAVCNAAEAAPDGRRKLAAALHRRADVAEIRTVDAFTSVQLHWGGQMWHMQPCSPALKVRRSWPVCRALSVSGPVPYPNRPRYDADR